ncbi:phospholipase D-like domain-containing protein [Notoacmeibacter sp. MSK16QG-6]|uniref:phospholipase D-like domain-containing protein n=1 Tax=Notoacmeibacter sp. MSK16QG-6 TaxID=2957982 RepID=UPI00209F33D1|nr:phospholipase D-like domain-containing protein [Notoacmeibacter sp. MSK16QG-6]MCP1201044.1 phospholipase D-like domain-containing protein [Notoacmeibacter sp. MSK16QG-6]
MTVVQVVFPVLKGSRRFIIERGRRWSVIEHLLLDAVSRGAASAAALAEQSNLPRRVVVEAFIRLMRAGWVEITATSQGPLFQITAAGTSLVHYEQLPSATVREPRWRGFAIEQLTGSVYRGRELDLCHKNQVPAQIGENPVAHLSASAVHDLEDMSEVFTTIEGEDEMIIGVDRGSEKLAERYAVVAVKDGEIEGLPGRAPEKLRRAILTAASEKLEASPKSGKAAVSIVAKAELVDEIPAAAQGAYDPADLIIDGDDHWRSFERIVSGASERVIIHSTFINSDRAKVVLPLLLRAAERGVTIDVLWGQDDLGSPTRSSQFAAAKMQADIDTAGRTGSIRVHPFSTNSHAKIVFADSQKGWNALIGSCNWLASDYKSFETSFRLREPKLVGQLMMKLAGLSQGRPGVWNDFAIDLAVLGRRIMEMPASRGRKVPMRLLYGADHARLVLKARDEATSRIFALSHRIGISAESLTLLPALAAVKENGIAASFFYGRTTGPLSGRAGADLVREFAKSGLHVKPIHKPRIHAKVLGWDDDNLAVSSLNWLSADPSEAKPFREIGVLVNAPKIADSFLGQFEHTVAP